MRIRVIAVGQNIHQWAREACQDYVRRFPKNFEVLVKEVKTEPRAGQTPAKLMANEAERILQAIEPGTMVIVLDEHGHEYTTVAFAQQLTQWQQDFDSLTFIIGGPDGLHECVKAKAHHTLRLSTMTLPHALARVVLLEQLYRVWSIRANHPYHRA